MNGFDHHCIWINNCIGKDNYQAFMVMIVSAEVYLVLFLVAMGLLWKENRWEEFLGGMILSWIVSVLAVIFVLMVGALIGLHIYLIKRNITTLEFVM